MTIFLLRVFVLRKINLAADVYPSHCLADTSKNRVQIFALSWITLHRYLHKLFR